MVKVQLPVASGLPAVSLIAFVPPVRATVNRVDADSVEFGLSVAVRVPAS